jgi:hypothetical protein
MNFIPILFSSLTLSNTDCIALYEKHRLNVDYVQNTYLYKKGINCEHKI